MLGSRSPPSFISPLRPLYNTALSLSPAKKENLSSFCYCPLPVLLAFVRGCLSGGVIGSVLAVMAVGGTGWMSPWVCPGGAG